MRGRPFALLAAVAVLAAACTSSGDELVVYSGRTPNLIEPVFERFADESDVSVAFRDGDSADLALLIDEEGDGGDADVFLSQSPGAMAYLGTQDRLAALPDELLDAVPERFRDPNGRWVGLSGRVRVLVYNTELVDEAELPDSVFDLTAPEYRDRVAVAPSNGSFQDFVTAMRQQVGDARAEGWLEGMADNGAQPYDNNTAIVQAVGRGEIPMGLVNHYYKERAVGEDPDLPVENHFFPDGDIGSLVLETAIGVLDSADRADEAEELVAYLLSEDAQRYFGEETFEYPLAAGVEPAVDLPELSGIDSPQVALEELGEGLRQTQAMIDGSGLASN